MLGRGGPGGPSLNREAVFLRAYRSRCGSGCDSPRVGFPRNPWHHWHLAIATILSTSATSPFRTVLGGLRRGDAWKAENASWETVAAGPFRTYGQNRAGGCRGRGWSAHGSDSKQAHQAAYSRVTSAAAPSRLFRSQTGCKTIPGRKKSKPACARLVEGLVGRGRAFAGAPLRPPTQGIV